MKKNEKNKNKFCYLSFNITIYKHNTDSSTVYIIK